MHWMITNLNLSMLNDHYVWKLLILWFKAWECNFGYKDPSGIKYYQYEWQNVLFGIYVKQTKTNIHIYKFEAINVKIYVI